MDATSEVESSHGLIAFCSHHLGQLRLPSALPAITSTPPPMPLLHAPATNALFPHHLDFIHQLTSTVEGLRYKYYRGTQILTAYDATFRFIDRPLRTERLRRDLKRLSQTTTFGFDPIGAAWEPRYRIVKVILFAIGFARQRGNYFYYAGSL